MSKSILSAIKANKAGRTAGSSSAPPPGTSALEILTNPSYSFENLAGVVPAGIPSGEKSADFPKYLPIR
jgi:hypothetical protein